MMVTQLSARLCYDRIPTSIKMGQWNTAPKDRDVLYLDAFKIRLAHLPVYPSLERFSGCH